MTPLNSGPRPALTDVSSDEEGDNRAESIAIWCSSRRMTTIAADTSWMIRGDASAENRWKPVRTYTVCCLTEPKLKGHVRIDITEETKYTTHVVA